MASLTLGHIWDIPIRAHWSFLLVLPLFAYLMGEAYFAAPGGAVVVDYAWGGLLAVTLFASVVAHELGHSWTARRYGFPIRAITLLPIGGVAQMKSMPEDPRQEMAVALAGPVVSVGIGLPVLAVHELGLVPAVVPQIGTFVYYVGLLNVFLGAFNLLIPAFPMDGGRVLRAALTGRMGRKRATEVAGGVGQGLAVAMGIGGFLVLGSGGWLLLLVALFVWLGAGQEVQQVRTEIALDGVTVGDAMTQDVTTVSPDDTVVDVRDRMRQTRHLAFPVVDGAVVGVVGLSNLAGVADDRADAARVADVMREDVRRAAPDEPARDLLKYLSKGEDDRLVVVEEGGEMVGIVSRTDLVRLIRILEGG